MLYLQETHPEGKINFFPNLCDFLNLVTTILYIPSFEESQLIKIASSMDSPEGPNSLELTMGLGLRLRAGIPQILTGEEKKHFPDGPLVAFPIVDNHELIGVLIQVQAPIYDIEDNDFLAYWDQLDMFFKSFLSPSLPSSTQSWDDQEILSAKKKILNCAQNPFEITIFWNREIPILEEKGLPVLPGPFIHTTLEVLGDLVGSMGGVYHKRERTLALFSLNPRLTQDLVLHQIKSSFPAECQELELSPHESEVI